MTIDKVKETIQGVINAKTVEKRNQRIDKLINDVPFDRNRIEEIKQDIDKLRMEAHHLNCPISVSEIKEIIKKYKL